MQIFQFICRYWIIFAFASAFYAGYYLRSLQFDAKQGMHYFSENNKNTKESKEFEVMQAEVDKLYNNINTRLTYADSYNCIIPADGLQLLKQATR